MSNEEHLNLHGAMGEAERYDGFDQMRMVNWLHKELTQAKKRIAELEAALQGQPANHTAQL